VSRIFMIIYKFNYLGMMINPLLILLYTKYTES